MINAPSLTLGVEEEYLVVDRETRDLVQHPDPGFLSACEDLIGEQVTPEYLQCQVEIGTKPVASPGEARSELARLRRGVAHAAARFGYAPIAASTHPFARWREQTHTRKPRYDDLRADLGQNVRRLLICGCHVHVGIEDEDLRVDLMNQAVYFLPHILALTCSSPFWEAEDTGLSSYRLSVFDALPRTGLPDVVNSYGEYERLVSQMVAAGCLEDATKIWWDVRPSAKFPTVESRISDVCTRVDDAACIAALHQCLYAFLWRLRSRNQRWRIYPQTLIRENRWRAQRYGTEGGLVDFGQGKLTSFADLVEEWIEMLGPEAERLGCLKELLHVRVMVRDGNSAARQRRALAEAQAAGAEPAEAFRAVVDHLIEETVADL